MSTLTFLLLFVFVLAIPAVSYFFYKRSTDQKVQAFLEQNPYAAKVYLPLFSRSGIHSVSVRISLVDGEVPVTFMEGFKTWVYLTPGKHVLEVSASKTRPGVVHKTVTTEYGPVDQEVEVVMGKEYLFSFDAKEEIFTLVEKE